MPLAFLVPYLPYLSLFAAQTLFPNTFNAVDREFGCAVQRAGREFRDNDFESEVGHSTSRTRRNSDADC